MKLNLKALGLALVAALAISAVAASTAGAEGPAQFTQPDDKYPVAITGHEEPKTENLFRITGETGPRTECDSVTYEGTLSEATSTITVTPHYTECEAHTELGTIPAWVDTNGCHFEFTAGEVTANGAKGDAKIICPKAENPTHEFITVTTAFCDTHVLPQTIEKGIEFTNTAEGDVTVDANVDQKLTYIETKTSIFGPCEDGFEGHDGSFISSVTVEGFEDLGTHHWTTFNDNDNDTDTGLTKETLTEGAALDIDVG